MTPIILIVDDCIDIARIIARHLANAGYRTLTANSAVDAHRVLERTIPDCILLDIMMPGMSGAEFLHQLRHDPKTATVPVVMVSARVGHHGTHFRSQLDADYSVGKPFTKQQIVGAVRTVLARKTLTPVVDDAPSPAAIATRRDAKSRLAEKLGLPH